MLSDDDPTPPSGLSFSILRDECSRFAQRMATLALLSRRRVDLIDIKRSKRCEQLSDELHRLSRQIGAWEHHDAATVALERDVLLPRMASLLREAITMLEALPSAPPLGPIRFR